MVHCSNAQLSSMVKQITASASLDEIHSAYVQQAFLPKFENEGQDASIADAVVTGAAERFMVITIKHSGSLVTLSGGQGFAAKNSLNNEFTAGKCGLWTIVVVEGRVAQIFCTGVCNGGS